MEHLKLGEIFAYVENIDTSDFIFTDMQLENQVRFLEWFKRYKDVEKGKVRGKGFANCWKFNHKRDPKVYTTLEAEFDRLARDNDLNLAHEIRIRVKDRQNRQHIFKLDFFDPSTRIDIEVSPNWHKNYRLVERRDVLRKRLLKRVGIRSLTVPVVRKGKRERIDVRIANRVVKTVLQAKPSRNCLDYYKGVIEWNI